MDLIELIKNLRARLSEYRYSKIGKEISIHVNAIEMSLCLVEFALDSKPHRKISKAEQEWFKASYHISMILENSEWEDLANMYYSLVEEVKKRNFFNNPLLNLFN